MNNPSIPNGEVGRPGTSILVRGLVLAVLAAAFIVARIPAYLSPQWGEEGMFSHLLLEDPPGPQYLLIGRVAGKAEYCPPEHPAPLYGVVKLAGKVFRRFVPQWRTLSDYELTSRLRLTQSLFQLAIFSAILWVVLGFVLRPGRTSASPAARWIPVALVGFVAVSPMAIRSSTGLQIDGACGVLLVGVLPVVLLANHFRPWLPTAFLLATFLASLLTGLGKQEWSMALVAAALVTLALGELLRRFRPGVPMKSHGVTVFAILAGCIVGNLASFLSDRVNWLGGIDVMTRIAKEPGQGQAVGLAYQLQYMAARLPFLFVVLLLIALVMVTLPRRIRDRDPWTFFLATYGTVLTAGFFVSWRTSFDPRYFAPAMIVLVCAAVLGLDGAKSAWTKVVALAVIVGIVIPSAAFIATALPSVRQARQKFDDVQAYVTAKKGASGCVPVLPAGYAYHPSAEFMAESIGEDYARTLVERHGRSLCAR